MTTPLDTTRIDSFLDLCREAQNSAHRYNHIDRPNVSAMAYVWSFVYDKARALNYSPEAATAMASQLSTIVDVARGIGVENPQPVSEDDLSDWRYEVAEGNTTRSFEDWLAVRDGRD